METWSTLEQVIWFSVLRSFARRVEQFLTQMRTGAVAPRESMDTQRKEGESSESLGYVPGAPASSSTAAAPLRQPPTPPRTPTTHIQSPTGAVAPRTSLDTPTRISGSGEPLGHVPGASVSSPAVSVTMPTPTPPTIPAPPIPTAISPSVRENAPVSPKRGIFETPIQHDYEAGVEVRSLLPGRGRWPSSCFRH